MRRETTDAFATPEGRRLPRVIGEEHQGPGRRRRQGEREEEHIRPAHAGDRFMVRGSSASRSQRQTARI